MITNFKIFEDLESYYTLDLNDLYKVYYDNFHEIYPDITLDINFKTLKNQEIIKFFRKDIHKLLKNKKAEFTTGTIMPQLKNGIIDDVWCGYFGTGYGNLGGLNYVYKFKINDKWNILDKSNKIKVYSKDKTELEKKLEIYSTANKYNL